jgi:hypothetical protein
MQALEAIMVQVEGAQVQLELPRQGVFVQMAGSVSRMQFSERAISGPEAVEERVDRKMAEMAAREVEAVVQSGQGRGEVDSMREQSAAVEASILRQIRPVETAVQTRAGVVAAARILISRIRVVLEARVSSSSV